MFSIQWLLVSLVNLAATLGNKEVCANPLVFQLDDRLIFPHPTLSSDTGLLAIGGDLSPERLLLAYSNGIFPWYSDDEPICWYSPQERCVLRPNELKLSKSMQKILRSNLFEITENKVFEAVVMHCANVQRKGQEGTWITNEMQQAYLRLHQLGYAKSIEVWQNNVLVGGLYGVSLKRLFCGESMFALQANASKIALTHLCQSNKYDLIDCQVLTSHLQSLGAIAMDRNDFLLNINEILNEH